jgi:ubiquinone/menaquinone biosynthesis C-methylase UbiE
MSTQHFDEQARDWDSDPAKVERALQVAEVMRQAIALHRHMRALEYGAGTGLLSFALRHDLGSITLADTSPGMLTVLQEKIAAAGAEDMHPLRLDLAFDPLPAQGFELTYSLMVLHHIDDIQAILRAFHQILEPGGVLCACDLDKEDGSFHQHEFHGHLGFERAEIQSLVEAAGFEDVRFSTAYTIQREGKSYPLFLLVARKPA